MSEEFAGGSKGSFRGTKVEGCLLERLDKGDKGDKGVCCGWETRGGVPGHCDL